MLVALALVVSAVPMASNAECLQYADLVEDCANVTGTLSTNEAILEATVGGRSPNTSTGATGNAEASNPEKCLGRVVVTVGECATPDPTAPALTLSDIAAFRPTAGANLMEPNGWAVVGLPTNFYSTGGQQVQPGTLLGGPAEVRFTPVAWTWDYGDGGTTRTTTPGGAWATLGLAEFDETPTSHIYATRGTYTITLEIDYAAEYRLGTGAWARIPGTLRVQSNPLTITLGSVTTVLVDKDCRQNPSGPGC